MCGNPSQVESIIKENEKDFHTWAEVVSEDVLTKVSNAVASDARRLLCIGSLDDLQAPEAGAELLAEAGLVRPHKYMLM